MYRTTASRLRSLKDPLGNSAAASYATAERVATKPPSSGGFFGWLTGESSSHLPRLDIPLPGLNLPPLLPDYVERSKTQITTLPNGLKIASEASPDPVASIGMYLDCGSIYETYGTNGASFFLERMAFKSTANRSRYRIVREVEAIGGELRASASREQITYTYDAPKTHVPEMVELLVDQVRNAAFLDWELKEELRNLKFEIEERHSNPRSILMEAIHKVGYRGALANSFLGPDYAINPLPYNLESFVSENYTAPRMVLAAYGVDHEELVSIAEPLLSDLPSVPRPEEPESEYVGGEYRCKVEEGPSHVVLAFEVPGGWRHDKQAVLQTVLKTLMGGSDSYTGRYPGNGTHSRLYLRVLNEYNQIRHFSAFNSMFNNSGLFGVYVTTRSDFVSKAIDIAAAELISIATPGQELNRAKESTKSTLLMELESRMIKSEDIGRQILTYGERKPIEHILKAVDEITLKDITDLSQKIISSPLTMGSLGNVTNMPNYESVSSKFNAK